MSAPAALDKRARSGALSVPGLAAQPLLTAGLAAVICVVALAADGGLQLGRTTPVLILLIVLGGGAVAGSLLLAPRRTAVWGATNVALLLALAVLTALSATWSANPSDTYLEANRTFAYLAVFAGAAALAHAVPGRWGAVLGAITLSAVLLSAYAVLTKFIPGALNPDEVSARLSEPFGYWNSVGLMAALAVPGLLWLATRRTGHQTLNALAYPALGLVLLTILLAYSRGALLAAAAGAGFWLATVKPLRLRGAAALLAGAGGAGLVAAWVFSQGTLSDDSVPLALREQAGHQLAVLVIAMLGVLTVVGLATGFVAVARPPGARLRQRIGVGLLVGLALVPVGVGAGMALSDKGLGGSISSTWKSLTDPDASLPINDPSRLTAAGSVRALYWDQAIAAFRDNPAVGVGAGGYATVRKRYRDDEGAVRHAHGYVAQTLADLGIVGLAVSMALLAAWLASAAKATGLGTDRRWPWWRGQERVRGPQRVREYSPERVGLLTLAGVTLAFGVHSTIDWTWFVPANAAVGLLAAGWIAGRGPLGAPAARRAHGSLAERLRAGIAERGRAVCAATVLLLALVAAWTAWQPLRSDKLAQKSLNTLVSGDVDAARTQAQRAHDLNPLAVDPLYKLARIEEQAGDRQKQARAALQQAVRLQPSNPETWLALANFELGAGEPEAAEAASRRAIYLDPRSSRPLGVFLNSRRQTDAGASTK